MGQSGDTTTRVPLPGITLLLGNQHRQVACSTWDRGLPQGLPTMRLIRSATFSYSPPIIAALLGVWGLYRATQVDDSESLRAFTLSIMLLAAAAAMGTRLCLRERTGRERELEDDVVDLRARLLALQQQLTSVQEDVNCRLATQAWLDTFDRVERNGHQAGPPTFTLHSRDGHIQTWTKEDSP